MGLSAAFEQTTDGCWELHEGPVQKQHWDVLRSLRRRSVERHLHFIRFLPLWPTDAFKGAHYELSLASDSARLTFHLTQARSLYLHLARLVPESSLQRRQRDPVCRVRTRPLHSFKELFEEMSRLQGLQFW